MGCDIASTLSATDSVRRAANAASIVLPAAAPAGNWNCRRAKGTCNLREFPDSRTCERLMETHDCMMALWLRGSRCARALKPTAFRVSASAPTWCDLHPDLLRPTGGRLRQSGANTPGAADSVPKSARHAVAAPLTFVVMEDMPALAAPQPAALCVPMVDRMMGERVREVAAQQADRRGARALESGDCPDGKEQSCPDDRCGDSRR